MSILEYITDYKNINDNNKIATADVSKEDVAKYKNIYKKCEKYLLKTYL